MMTDRMKNGECCSYGGYRGHHSVWCKEKGLSTMTEEAQPPFQQMHAKLTTSPAVAADVKLPEPVAWRDVVETCDLYWHKPSGVDALDVEPLFTADQVRAAVMAEREEWTDFCAKMIREATASERERILRIISEWFECDGKMHPNGEQIAAAIRSGS